MEQEILHNKKSAFTLVELAVVLVIAALMIGQFVNFSIQNQERLQQVETEEKLEYIMEAIKQFAIEEDEVPCPADGALLLNHEEYGFEQNSGTDCDVSSANLSSTTGNVIVGGVLPVHTLNIGLEYMTDGWGRKFTYIVDEDLRADADVAGNIVIRSLTAGGSLITNNAGVVVISHGANGFGAWNARGGGRHKATQLSAAATPLQNENTDVDNVFIQNLLVSPSGSDEVYDDILEYRLNFQLKD